MARTQKYTEELLLEAVVKYAETERGKIKATELAEWAGANITGLEGVRDYHFMRPVREKDPQTGAVTMRRKPCTVRMDEINRARNLTAQISRNALLKASTIEEFMNQPGFIQPVQAGAMGAQVFGGVDVWRVGAEQLRQAGREVPVPHARIDQHAAGVKDQAFHFFLPSCRFSGELM